MIQFRSLRAKGRHISVEIRRSVMKHLFTSIPPGGDQSKSPEWATLKNELEKLSPRYSRLQFELSADNDCSNISEWLSHQDLRHLRRLVILGNSAYSASSDKIALPSIPQINSLRVSHVVVTGDLSNVQSLTCFANTSTDWSPWSALIHSCVQLHFLKLTIPNAPMEGNLVIDLPSLKELQVGRPAVHGRGSLTWCERFGSLIGSLRAPNLRSMTIFNTRISSPHEEASIWPALYQAAPQINTLKLVEKYAFSNPASSFICLDALCEPSNSNGFLFPLVEHLGIFAIPTPSKTAHEKLMTLIENRVSTTSLVRFSVSSKLCTSLKGEYGDALDGFQSTFPNFKILDVPEERVPELWP
ncbi:hypothetical protein DL93DRAFT_2091223 [Clavulina sp. PMI_390]|nr:hypothetical protein DL93DRAFT_2091223 [Clavulina sp. PMI_390]